MEHYYKDTSENTDCDFLWEGEPGPEDPGERDIFSLYSSLYCLISSPLPP